eukprot:523124-Rhodomonas_salina.1
MGVGVYQISEPQYKQRLRASTHSTLRKYRAPPSRVVRLHTLSQYRASHSCRSVRHCIAILVPGIAYQPCARAYAISVPGIARPLLPEIDHCSDHGRDHRLRPVQRRHVVRVCWYQHVLSQYNVLPRRIADLYCAA